MERNFAFVLEDIGDEFGIGSLVNRVIHVGHQDPQLLRSPD